MTPSPPGVIGITARMFASPYATRRSIGETSFPNAAMNTHREAASSSQLAAAQRDGVSQELLVVDQGAKPGRDPPDARSGPLAVQERDLVGDSAHDFDRALASLEQQQHDCGEGADQNNSDACGDEVKGLYPCMNNETTRTTQKIAFRTTAEPTP